MSAESLPPPVSRRSELATQGITSPTLLCCRITWHPGGVAGEAKCHALLCNTSSETRVGEMRPSMDQVHRGRSDGGHAGAQSHPREGDHGQSLQLWLQQVRISMSKQISGDAKVVGVRDTHSNRRKHCPKKEGVLDRQNNRFRDGSCRVGSMQGISIPYSSGQTKEVWEMQTEAQRPAFWSCECPALPSRLSASHNSPLLSFLPYLITCSVPDTVSVSNAQSVPHADILSTGTSPFLHPDRASVISPGSPTVTFSVVPLLFSLCFTSVSSIHSSPRVLLKPKSDHICFVPFFKPSPPQKKDFPSHFKQKPTHWASTGPDF